MKLLLALLSLVASISCVSAADDLKFSNPQISVGVVVADLDVSVAFYTEVIGMTQTGGFEVPGEVATNLGLTADKALRVTVLKLADTPEAPQWKLMSFGDSAKPQRTDYIDGFTGMQYITLSVSNLTPFVTRLKAHGVKLLGATPVALDSERDFVLVQDPDGVFIELIGPSR
jgi:catechol 2,3-dioxygenase-like lactoylglutathione lyase family enzyme